MERIEEEHFQDTCGAEMIFEDDVYEENEEIQMEDLDQALLKFEDMQPRVHDPMEEVQENQEKFVAIIRSLWQQRACRLPKSTVAKCHNNSQLYHEIKCEEGREGCRDILKLCRDLVKAEEKKECCDFSKLCCDKANRLIKDLAKSNYKAPSEA